MYHIIFADAWDEETQEVVSGGRCVATVEDGRGLLRAIEFARLSAAFSRWGLGMVIVTDGDGVRIPDPLKTAVRLM